MLIIDAPPGLRAGGWRILGLEALVDPGRRDLLAILAERVQELGWIADHFSAQAPLATQVAELAAPIDTAREALIRAEAVDSIDLLADAMAAMARLNPDELALLRETMPFRPIIQATDELRISRPQHRGSLGWIVPEIRALLTLST